MRSILRPNGKNERKMAVGGGGRGGRGGVGRAGKAELGRVLGGGGGGA